MAEKLSLQIEINGQEKVINNVKELKKAIREAEFDAFALSEQFGESDPRVVKIREEVGKLKNAMQDATDQAKAFSQDSKFPAVAKSIQGLASGFTAVQGAMSLLGVQGESVEKALLKVQSALAISEGLGGVIESIDSFKILNSMIANSTILKKADILVTGLASKAQMFFTGAVITTSTAFKTLKAAIVSTGIGAIIVLVGILVSKMMEWADSTEDVEKETKNLNDQLERNNKLTEESLKGIDYVTKMQLANAKKRGASAKELAKIESDADAERLKELKKNVAQQEGEQEKIRKNKKATKEQIDAVNKAVLEADKRLNDEVLAQQLKTAEKEADIAEDGRKKQTERNQKRKQDNDAAQKDREQKLKEAQEIELEAYKATLSERQKEELDAENKLKENKKKLQAAGIKDFTSIENQYQIEIAAIKKKYTEEEADKLRGIELASLELKKEQGLLSEDDYQKQLYEIKKAGAKSTEELLNAEVEYTKFINTKKEKLAEQERQTQIDNLQSQIENLDKKNAEFEDDFEQDLKRFEEQKKLLEKQEIVELENTKLSEYERTQIKKKYSDERTNIEIQAAQTEKDLAEAKKQVQFDMLAAVGGALGSLSGMFEKGTAAAKVAALSEIAVNTGLGFLQGLDIAQKGAKATGPAAPFAFPIFYATQIAAVLGAVSKAKAALSQVKGGGSTPNASAPSNAAPMQPKAPQAQMTQLNQDSINALGNQAIKAYVIESDMTSNQQRIAAIRQRARFT